MSIIIISRGFYRRGSEVAQKASAEIGYECISREVLLEASKLFDVPELKLTRAIQDAPSLLDRLGRDKKKYVAFIQIRTGLSIHMRLTEKQKIMEKVESIAIGLGGAEKVHVTFETPT